MLEALLRQRDTDNELYHSLGLKSLEIGLKIRLLETDTGGKTVEVGVGNMRRAEPRIGSSVFVDDTSPPGRKPRKNEQKLMNDESDVTTFKE